MTDTQTQPENIRPWGRYDILETGEGFQVKCIVVEPGQRLSYQRHQHRSEYWVIVDGEAEVTLNDVIHHFSKDSVVIVPLQAKHRVKNVGTTPLVFIETQLGVYLGEDDIERFDDDYGRIV